MAGFNFFYKIMFVITYMRETFHRKDDLKQNLFSYYYFNELFFYEL